MLILLCFIPESPHYLIAAGQPERARQVLMLGARMNHAVLPKGKLLAVGGNRQGANKTLHHTTVIAAAMKEFLRETRRSVNMVNRMLIEIGSCKSFV